MQSGDELRTGAAVVTATANHYDGGWTSAGISGFHAAPTVFWITGTGPDEPDAVWNATWERATWVDHGSQSTKSVVIIVSPVLPDKQLELNVELIDSSIERSVIIPGPGNPGGESDDTGMYLRCGGSVGTILTKACRFADNAGDGGLTRGGIHIRPPAGGSLSPTMVFEDSEWIDNLSDWGPAIYVFYGQADIRFHRCQFRCDTVLLFRGRPAADRRWRATSGATSRSRPAARSLCSGRRRCT